MADPTPDARGSTGVRPLHPPAPHAGINPVRTGGHLVQRNPRTRGDRPSDGKSCSSAVAITSSDCWFGRQRRPLPRVCGDQPQQDMRAPLLQDATPRARGCTRPPRPPKPRERRYPARAGMYLEEVALTENLTSLPRARGDKTAGKPCRFGRLPGRNRAQPRRAGIDHPVA